MVLRQPRGGIAVLAGQGGALAAHKQLHHMVPDRAVLIQSTCCTQNPLQRRALPVISDAPRRESQACCNRDVEGVPSDDSCRAAGEMDATRCPGVQAAPGGDSSLQCTVLLRLIRAVLAGLHWHCSCSDIVMSGGLTGAAQLEVQLQASEGSQLICWRKGHIYNNAMLPLHHLPAPM